MADFGLSGQRVAGGVASSTNASSYSTRNRPLSCLRVPRIGSVTVALNIDVQRCSFLVLGKIIINGNAAEVDVTNPSLLSLDFTICNIYFL